MDALKVRRSGGVVIPMSNIKYLLGRPNYTVHPLIPYNEKACAFCDKLSQELLANPNSRAFPDIITFAFWCRKSNILQLKKQFNDNEKRIGRGLTFHIAPSNIPVNFAFSFLFSLLAGNGNIVRIPSKSFPQIKIICEAIQQIFTDDTFAEIRDNTTFVEYPSSDNKITAEFSAISDVRIIWGGDATINMIRKLPTKPRCVDVCFADRYSAAIINGQAVLAADKTILRHQAEKFYNDTYLMDQNACSSPQIIFWYNVTQEIKERFWEAVEQQAQKQYFLQPASAMDKYTQLCQDIIEKNEVIGLHQKNNFLSVVSLARLPQDTTILRGKCGYFYEFELETLSEIASYINEKYQTITYFGIDPEEVRELVLQNHLTGIDRIVPFGSAMDIGVIWDGYDIIQSLSRIIALR